MTRTVAVLTTIAAGLLVGLQPAANSALSKHVGDFGAAFVSITISATVIALLLLTAGHPGELKGLGSIKPEQLIGGLGGAAVVTIGLVAVRPLGAGAVVALLVAAQLVMSVIADQFGWLGLRHVSVNAPRLVGLVLVIAGTVLVSRR